MKNEINASDSGQKNENQTVSHVMPVGEPALLAEEDDIGRIFCYKENDVYEIRIEMRSYKHSYFMTGEEWQEFTDSSGQDERKEFFILLKEKYPELDKHLENSSIRMEFLKFVESSYDGSQTPEQAG